MGNRAVIARHRHPRAAAVYLHWNGGRASVEAFLEAARRLGLRHVGADDASFFDRLAEMIAVHFFGGRVGFTVYRYELGRADCDNRDNGLYLIDDDLMIVGREFAPRYEETDPAKTDTIADAISSRAPCFNDPPPLAPGQIVRFVRPVEPGDAALRLEVLELRGARVLVHALGAGMSIEPTFAYPLAEVLP